MKKLPFLIILILFFFQFSSVSAQEKTVSRSTVIEQYKGKPYYIHFVKQGETLAAIAKAYNVTTDELAADNPDIANGLKTDQVLMIPQRPETLAETPVQQEPQREIKAEPRVSKPESGSKVYIVKKKETLYGIAKKFNVSMDDLLQANPQMKSLQEGMELTIPAPEARPKPEEKKEVKTVVPTESKTIAGSYQEVTVQKGQTAYSLSKLYGITVEQFLGLNPSAAEGLKTGQLVKVPALKTEILKEKEVEKAARQEKKSAEPEIQAKVKPVMEDKPLRSSVSRDSCYNKSNILKTYNIALLLPLNLEDADSILAQGDNSTKTTGDYKTFDFFQFYSGLMLAADSLEKAGFRARIHVLDADKEGDTLKTRKALRKNELSGMDLVIGPVFSSGFDVASRYARKEKVNIVNPLSRRDKITAGNPRLFKAQPSEESIAEGMAGYIIEKYPDANLIVIRNGKELSSLYEDFVQAVKKEHKFPKSHLKEVNYATDAMKGVTNALSAEGQNLVFMFTVSRTVVPNFVSLLNGCTKLNQLILFGMPGWENIDIETEFLVNLDYHQFSSSFIDYQSEPVKQFVKQFRSTYGAEPLSDKQAFLGFDLGWYFFRALMNYGTDFGPCLKFMDVNGLQYNFRFAADSPRDGYVNSSYKIIRLQDYKWVEAR